MRPEGHVWRPAVAHEDDRGRIVDLFVGEPFDAITVITQRKGSRRGDHYHRETLQILYLTRGTIRVITQLPGEEVRTELAEAGDLIRTPPIERHAIVAVQDAEYIVFTRGPRAGKDFESDTFRLSEPLAAGRSAPPGPPAARDR